MLGVAVEDADEASVQRLIDAGVEEDDDVDFKAASYGLTDADKRALAGDVAALANHVGGLLLLGVTDEDGRATNLSAVSIAETEGLRMQQVLTALVFPYVDVAIRRVATDDDPNVGYWLLLVPPSSTSPHGVRVNDGFRYPRRDGRRIRWLHESEIADAYRSRFATQQGRLSRITEVINSGVARLADSEGPWLRIALVPERAGAMRVTSEQVDHIRGVFLPGRPPRPHYLSSAKHLQLRGGLRRIVGFDARDDGGQTKTYHVELHADGSGFAAVSVGHHHVYEDVGDIAVVVDEWLSCEVPMLVEILAAHAALNSRTGGDAILESDITDGSGSAVWLTHPRGGPGFSRWTDSTALTDHSSPQRTIPVEPVLASRPELFVAAHLVLEDLFQLFEVPEPGQISADGQLRDLYFSTGAKQYVKNWAEQLGIDLLP